ncbi:MAG TPA: DNA repair protein RecN [Anaerolineae bacterium]|nr:DNA repair protein RecN [Anaerolineae bacterium]
MLTYLTIRNFAIIDQLELSPSTGFNALTGETGAGKSIIIDAVSTLLGGRAETDQIRAGTEQAFIEGVFSPSQALYEESVLPLLQEHGLADHDRDALILTREINRGGRNICRVNGRLVTLGVLRQIGQRLVDIHNQGEHLSLLRVRQHIDFLDRYAGLQSPRAETAARVHQLHETRSQLGSLLKDERELARRIDLLKYQVQEIDAAKLQVGEEEELATQHKILANAEKLITQTDLLYNTLAESDDVRGSVLDLVGEVSAGLARLAEVDPRLEEQHKTLEAITYQLQETAGALRSYREGIDYDPARLRQVEERLDLIHDLKRKYGDSIEEILAFAVSAADELDGLAHSEERIEELHDRERALLGEIARLASQLSQARQHAAESLAQGIEAELRELGMEKARFAVSIAQREMDDGVQVDGKRYAFDSTGMDQVEFMISPNVGEPLKPLSRIASGGETARLMLAVKTVLSRADDVPVLIFDEIDAGLGGRAGAVIGRKLWALARNHQVLCVTHLPQIAAFGDTHYRVAKEVHSGRTTTSVDRLEPDGSTEELAQMLGADSEATFLSAREMRAEVEKWKAAHAPQ